MANVYLPNTQAAPLYQCDAKVPDPIQRDCGFSRTKSYVRQFSPACRFDRWRTSSVFTFSLLFMGPDTKARQPPRS
jgi:hypothetical protein